MTFAPLLLPVAAAVAMGLLPPLSLPASLLGAAATTVPTIRFFAFAGESDEWMFQFAAAALLVVVLTAALFAAHADGDTGSCWLCWGSAAVFFFSKLATREATLLPTL